MVIGVDIKLEPVPMSTTGSGELFKFRLKHGVTFLLDVDHYITIGTSDASGIVTYQYFSNDEKTLTVSEAGNGIQEIVFKILLKNIRYIQCYYE